MKHPKIRVAGNSQDRRRARRFQERCVQVIDRFPKDKQDDPAFCIAWGTRGEGKRVLKACPRMYRKILREIQEATQGVPVCNLTVKL